MLLLFKISKPSFKKYFILKAARRAEFFVCSQKIQSQTDKSGDFMSTIAAISTGLAAGGIGIVRISGENALNVADSIFKTVQGIELKKLSGYRAAFGRVFSDGKPIDEAVALVFRAPKSYTGEDVVEISCHGGLYITKQVLRAALKNGAVPAEPGEFTKRAFLKGKTDLTKAEAVMGIISAHGKEAGEAAFSALEGALYKEIHKITDVLLKINAALAAWVDYPDDEIEELTDESILDAVSSSKASLKELLNRFDAGQAITEGTETAIVGRPNVGKSTLMNMLTGTEKSIVTSVAGTTRDIVEETVTIGNVTLRLADTAGLRETDDAVESIGVERAKKKIAAAKLIIAVFDSSCALSDEDREIFDLCSGKSCLAVINKTDLEQKIDEDEIKRSFENIVYISAKENSGLDSLRETIEKILGTANFDTTAALLMNERQLSCCEKAYSALCEAENAEKTGVTRDAIQVCIDSAIENLMVLTGEKATESVVNEIFSQFCVGK